MATNLIEKLLDEAVRTGGTYIDITVSAENVAFSCDGGGRKSTRNYHQALSEIKADEDKLKALNDRCLLFAGSLKSIRAKLSDGRTVMFQKSWEGRRITIKGKRVNELKEKLFQYIQFCPDDMPTMGVAFYVTEDKNGKKNISNCIGALMNGPNEADLSTDLHFIISGDLKTKKGILDSRFAEQNENNIERIAEILKAAIKELLHLGLLGMPLFAVLPSTLDEESPLNMKLIDAVKEISYSYPLFKNRSGTIVSHNKIIYGTDEVTELFPQKLADPFLHGKYWLEPCSPGSREEYFIVNDMNIHQFDREEFLKILFDEDYFDECSQMIAEQNDKWLRSFYIFCSIPVAEETTRRLVVSGLKNIRSIRNSKGKMFFPDEIAYATDIEEVGKKAVIIKPGIISPGGRDDEYSDQLRQFFLNDLGIKEYSIKQEIEDLATALTNKKHSFDKTYATRLLTLARFDEKNPNEIDFSSYAIFPYESKRGISRAKADKLVIGKPYIREGSLLAAATGRDPLWSDLGKFLKDRDLNSVISFTEKCGAIGQPRIIKQKAENHREYKEKLFAQGKQGVRDSNFDYTIPGLEELLKRRSIQLNKMVWSALLAFDGTEDVLIAEYSVDNRTIVNRCESSLIEVLKDHTWVLGKDGKLHVPKNINPKDIHENFAFDKKNPILKALQFGTGIKEREQALKEMMKLAKKEGLRLISEEEYQEFLKWKKN